MFSMSKVGFAFVVQSPSCRYNTCGRAENIDNGFVDDAPTTPLPVRRHTTPKQPLSDQTLGAWQRLADR